MRQKNRDVNLYMGSEVEALATQLAHNLNKHNADPFVAPLIIVPNPNLRKWLQLHIAACNGIVLHVDFDFLEKGIWRLLSSGQSHQAEDFVLVGISELRLLVLSVLMQHVESDEDLLPLCGYLYRDGAPVKGYWRKLWQLAGRLARYLRDYTYHRGEVGGMVDRWRNDVLSEDEMERCQQRVYNLIFADRAFLDERNKERDSKHFLLRDFFLNARSGLQGKKLPEVHLFGFSHISRLHNTILFEIASHAQLSIYHLNPYQNFYINSPAEGELFAEDYFQRFEIEGSENIVLAQWGKAARDMLALFEEYRTQVKVVWCAPQKNKQPENFLCFFQKAVLSSEQEIETLGMAQDTSLQVVACPGMQREVEMVYNSIISNMLSDDSLRLTDVAVLVTDMKSYRPVIDAVFSGQQQAVPYNLTDSSAGEESVFGAAMLSLLALGSQGFSRKELFELFFNPCFLAGVGASRQDAMQWLEWADALNIFHDRAAWDEQRRFSWQWGLRRLRLGAIMDVAEEFEESGIVRSYGEHLPYADMGSRDQKGVGRFSLLLESLQMAIGEISHAEMDSTSWYEKISELVEQFLGIPQDFPAEAYVRHRLFEDLHSLQDLHGSKEKIPFPLLVEYIRDNLASIPAGRGNYLSGGVTISSLMPMRPVPFKIAYVLGLGEGLFPGYDDESSLNLTVREYRAGDLSYPDANRYLFLESLLSVREKLYLSYVSRDTQKEADLAPCGPLKQLLAFLDLIISGDDPFQIVELPLYGRSVRYLSDSESNWSDLLCNFSRVDRVLALLELRNRGLLSLTEPQQKALEQELAASEVVSRVGSDSQNSLIATESIVELSLAELVRFLVDPAEAVVRRHLRLYDQAQEDKSLKEEEPFFSEFPTNYLFPVKLLNQYVVSQDIDALDQFAKQYYEYLGMQGATPGGVFSKNDYTQQLAAVHERIEGVGKSDKGLEKFLTEREAHSLFVAPQFGKSVNDCFSSERLSPLEIELDGGPQVLLSGSIPFLWRNKDASVVDVLVITNSAKEKPTHWLGPLLFYMCAQAELNSRVTALAAADQCDIYIATKKDMQKLSFSVSKTQAKSYLFMLMSDFLEEKIFSHIPLDVVLSRRLPLLSEWERDASPEKKISYKKIFEEQLAEDDGNDMGYVASEVLQLAEPEVPVDLYDIIERRLVPLFDTFVTKEEAGND